ANGGEQTYSVAIDPATGLISGTPELLSTGFTGFDNGFNALGDAVSTGGVSAAFGGAALGFSPTHGNPVYNGDGTTTFSGGSVSDYNASATVTLKVEVTHGILTPVTPGLTVIG